MSTDATGPNGSTIEHKQSELREIRKDLRKYQVWLKTEDSDLFTAIEGYIVASHDLPMGSIQARVQSRLLSLQETPKHKLRPHRGVDDPEEAFPDACEDCTHYGGRCPVLANKLGRDTLQRHYREAGSDEELLGRLSEFAAQRHCDVLKDEIESGQTTYREFVKRGEKLRYRALVAVSDMNDDVLDDMDTDFDFSEVTSGSTNGATTTPQMGEPPTEEIAEKVEAITAAVTADDEEED